MSLGEALSLSRAMQMTNKGGAAGKLLKGLAVVSLLDTGYALAKSAYALEVEARAFSYLQQQGKKENVLIYGLREAEDLAAPALSHSAVTAGNKNIQLAILKADQAMALETRQELRAILQGLLMSKMTMSTMSPQLAARLALAEIFQEKVTLSDEENALQSRLLKEGKGLPDRLMTATLQSVVGRLIRVNPHVLDESFPALDDLETWFKDDGTLKDVKGLQSFINWVVDDNTLLQDMLNHDSRQIERRLQFPSS